MLAFHDNGDGRPIVWIHGFPHASAVFQPQIAVAGVRHIRIDLPGFGASPAPSHDLTISDYSHEVLAVLDHLRIEKTMPPDSRWAATSSCNCYEMHRSESKA